MNPMKKISLFAISSVLLVGCAACGTATPPKQSLSAEPSLYTSPDAETYDNRAYNDYLLGNEGKQSSIQNQWPGYGIGDPFIMRWNGAYYLYVSSLDTEVGIRGYKSADLVNWAPMTGEGLKTGFVSMDPLSAAAFAPEVYYFNGKFYLYTSPGGGGHYVFTSDSPEGPFVAATGNFGLNIDGSVFIDDDESMYFLFANDSGIRMARMKNMLEVDATSSPTLSETSIGGWTEGPCMIKRDGIYYLTYTGNHVASDGYRIAYSTATDIPAAYRSAFTRAQNNPLALETETELKGIGHSSTVMGPDMDSHYLVYHYLNSSGGPNRSLGIDRLTFNGRMMSVGTTLEKSVKPALPAFYAMGKDEEKFAQEGDCLLSATAAPASFTAEFNLTGAASSTYVFAYTDASNYCDVTVDLTAKTIKLNKTTAGTKQEIASGELKNDFAADKLHAVRIASREGKVDVAFDNMTKIDDAALQTTPGRIGYKGLSAEAELGYTAYSEVAMGMSDEQEAKQANAFIGAADYLHDSTYCAAPVLKEGSAVSTVSADTDFRFDGWKELTLASKGDRVSYRIYEPKAGRYALELVYRAADAGKKVGVKIDGVNGGTVYRCTLPEVKSENEYVKACIGEFELTAGAHIVRIENLGKSVTYTAFRFTEAANITPQYEESLENYADRGADYKTIWKLKDGGHYAKAGTRQLVYFGDNTIGDFTLSVKIEFDGDAGTSTAGIVFHAQNYASSPHDSYMSLSGYYLAVNNDGMQLERLNYADDSGILAANMSNKFASNRFYTLEIRVRGNEMTVSVDGEKVMTAWDDWGFANGKVGLYTNGAAAVFKDLKIGA